MFILTLALCAVGLWISVYFTGVFYGWFKPDVFWMPQVCQLKEESCMTVLGTPRAKLFGLPNSLFGIAVYTTLLLGPLGFPPSIALALISIALARSVYLAYSLLFITKIPCPLCFTTHGINLALFVIYLKDMLRG